MFINLPMMEAEPASETVCLLRSERGGRHCSECSKFVNCVQANPWLAISSSASQEFSTFDGTWMFFTFFTTARHWSLFWSTWIQPTYSNIFLHLRLGLPNCLCISSPLARSLNSVIFLSHACYIPYPSSPPWPYTWWRMKVMKFLNMQFSATS
jgi:hypothetical protein